MNFEVIVVLGVGVDIKIDPINNSEFTV